MKTLKEFRNINEATVSAEKRVSNLIKQIHMVSSNMEQIEYQVGNYIVSTKDKTNTIRNLGFLQDDLEDIGRDVGILKRLIKDSK